MVKTFSWIAAGAIVIAACSGTGTEEGSSNTDTTAASAATETTSPTPVPTTTTSMTAPPEAVTTTEPALTTSTTTTTSEPPGEVNPPDVESWWCSAFEVAAGQSPVDFAQALADDFRHGYSEVPAGSLEEAADQAVLVACDPEYGRAVAAALGA